MKYKLSGSENRVFVTHKASQHQLPTPQFPTGQHSEHLWGSTAKMNPEIMRLRVIGTSTHLSLPRDLYYEM